MLYILLHILLVDLDRRTKFVYIVNFFMTSALKETIFKGNRGEPKQNLHQTGSKYDLFVRITSLK